MKRVKTNSVFIVIIMALMVTMTSCGGYRLKVEDTTLTFRIDKISRDSVSIEIPLSANDAIPIAGLKFLKMNIVIDGVVIESSKIEISGIIENSNFGRSGIMQDGKLRGYVTFKFPTTKKPDEIIVYNKYNESIKFKSGAIIFN